MTRHHTQQLDTAPNPRPERAPTTWALTEAELAQVVGGTDGPGTLGDNNGRQ